MTPVFENIESYKYYKLLMGKVLNKKELPKDVFEDLKSYDESYFFLKGKHVFKSIEE